MLDRCGEIEFSLYGGEGDALVEGVATLKVSGATPGLNGRWLYGDKTKNQASKDSLWGVGEAAKNGRGGPQDGENFLQGGGTGGTTFWLRDLGNFGSDGEEGGGHTHGFSEADNKEAGAAEGRREVSESQGGSSAGT